MKLSKRIVGLIFVLAGISACAASSEVAPHRAGGPVLECRAGGAACRWGNQCCSGRCYVDLGCGG
jgi:hypothetical protein